jgi:hypothetical protein
VPRPSAAEQLARNQGLAAPVIESLLRGPSLDREAACRLFSCLAHLEEIAVMAAKAGGGVTDQLADEIAHRDTFRWIAAELGQPEPISVPVAALTRFLAGLSAEESILCLNLVAESWLENVFHHLADASPFRELFRVIEGEEARHAHEAAGSAASVDPVLAKALVGELEEHLWAVTCDPHFLWPLAWFTGVQEVGRMGRRAAEMHRAACAAMGIEPGPYLGIIAQCGDEGAGDLAPVLVESTPWEAGAFALGLRPMSIQWRARWRGPRDLRTVEARVTQAISAALAAEPRLNRTTVGPRAEIWRPRLAAVGVRRLWDDDHLMTLFVREAHARTTAAVADRLSSLARDARALPYPPPPDVPEGLARLAPPSRVAATVSVVVGAFPAGATGVGPLVPQEGATWAVFATSFERDWLGRWFLNLSAECDHRAHGGLEMGRFASLVKSFLES